MTKYYMDMLWSIDFRYGIGFDVESCWSRPVWTMRETGEIEAMSFDGIVICLPFIIICIGNVWGEAEDADDFG